MHTLLMCLVGPMQSWGHRSRFDERDTGLEPTRSGVIGLLCAAMGIPRDADLSRFDRLRMGVRVDAPGRVMVDYHTAMNVVRADSSGLERTVTSHRYYLADARFLVGLESDDLTFLRDVDAALQNPAWPLYLGRKSFCLSAPVYLPGGSIQEGKSLEEALGSFPWHRLRRWEDLPDRLRLVLEPRDRAGAITLIDRPTSFADRRFALRRVTTDYVSANDGGVLPCIYPD